MKNNIKYIVLILLCSSVSVHTRAQEYETDRLFEISKNLEIFSETYKNLNAFYVDPLDPSTIMKTAIDAMVNSLDPYTVYYSENLIERSRYANRGKFDGIGADLVYLDNFATISRIYKGYVADRNNLKVGDRIISLNGRSTKGMSMEEMSTLMKGANDSALKLGIFRPAEESEFEVEMSRENRKSPNVPYSGILEGDVGYISLSVFTPNAAANIRKAFLKLKEENPKMKGLILDLKNNGGGLLGEAVKIVSQFVPAEKLVVSTRGKIKEEEKTYKTGGTPLDLEIPLVLLVNERSASASEIVSGALQDYDRAVIIGSRTYGKGLVQVTKNLPYHNRMKLTISRYYIPSGRCIQAVEYKDGKPVDIPESKRNKFTTANGRVVHDGGGIKPDILEEQKKPQFVTALQEQYIIFKYVNEFQAENDKIGAPEEYEFDKFNDFKKFVIEQDIEITTQSQKTLEKLKEEMENDVTSKKSMSLIQDLEKELNNSVEQGLDTHEEMITDLLSEEIVSRYYYEEGQIRKRLDHDKGLELALGLLQDEKKYNEILSGQ